MKLRFDGYGWTCECNSTMFFLEGLYVARRRMVCCGKDCKFQGKVVFEPVFEAEADSISAAVETTKSADQHPIPSNEPTVSR